MTECGAKCERLDVVCDRPAGHAAKHSALVGAVTYRWTQPKLDDVWLEYEMDPMPAAHGLIYDTAE